MLKLKTNKYLNIGQALQSQVTLTSLKMTIDRELIKFGYIDEDVEIDIQANWDNTMFKCTVIKEDTDYDMLMNHKDTAIGDLDWIKCSYYSEQVFVNYDVTIRILFLFKCKLPDEDINTLYQLGKVKHTSGCTSPSYTSVICEI